MAKWLDNLKEVIVRLAGENGEKNEDNIGEEASQEELREHFERFGVAVVSVREEQLEQSLEGNRRTPTPRVSTPEKHAEQDSKPKIARSEKGREIGDD